jgi:restriction system protein
MSVPSLFDLTLPVLKIAAQSEISYSEAADKVAQQLSLTPEDAAEMLPSGRERKLVNRIKWAKVELGMAAMVEGTKPSHFRITDAGRKVLAQNPTKLDHKFLMGIPEYRAYADRRRERAANAILTPTAEASTSHSETPLEASGITPQEAIEQAIQQIDNGLAAELRDRLAQASPSFFEQVVIRLLVAMGYGGARLDAGMHLGRSGDGGIDGVINQDPLGLDGVYIQAKRYGPTTASVGEPDLRNFVGSLVGRAAHKGVFVTTGSFSSSARTYIRSVPHRIVLIDGGELARLMVLHNVGVRAERTIPLKTIDAEFFDEG